MRSAAAARPEPRPWLLALLSLAGLTPFFFLTYGFANWATGLRAPVPSLAFAWERHIPFLAWTIVPYWTTDFFYAGAILLCRTRRELGVLARRLFATQVLCVAGFLLVPLQFSFARPHPAGIFGRLFDALMSFDRPFNQAPSLHVALTAVLWMAYGRHVTGWLWWVVRGWFVLMALSTLTTYQHHFIDVPTGLWVGLLAAALFPYASAAAAFEASRDPRRFALAAAYFAGALVCGLAAWRLGGAEWLLLWPAGALALVAAIYSTGRAELFRKTDGAMPAPVLVLLAPYLAAAWLNSRWHTRRQPLAHEIASGVWLGRLPRRAERAALGIRSVVDLTAELPIDAHGVAYRGVPMLDLLAPSPVQIAAAVEAIAALESQRPTLVCCALGFSRSAAAVAAWMAASGRSASVERAIETIRVQRPAIVLPPSYRGTLAQWAATRATR